jgi:peptidoglycan/xylan/chitin deacetylase (PgdA/CDA1 family)
MIWLGVLIFYLVPLAALLVSAWCAAQELRRDRVPILLYHRFISREDVRAGRVPDDEMIWVCYDDVFAGQMEYLARHGYTTLSLNEFLDIHQGRRPAPPKPVLITIDDGYASNYTLAFPALKRFGLKAVIYVAPEPDEHTRNLVAGRDGFLTPEQMRELSAHGVEIQSHTLTHCVLNTLPDEQVRWELQESRRRLEEYTGRPVEHLAIPRAGHSRRVRQLVAQSGYKTACCNAKGSANSSSDLLALPRFVVERDMSVEDFARLLTPRTAAVLRILGNLKRIPEWLGGSDFAGRVRRVLYHSPIGRLFETRNLKRLVAGFAAVYACGTVLFTWYLLRG